jgi:hypothetical protein
MVRSQILTRQRNRVKTSRAKRVTGTVPAITAVEAVTGEADQIRITFSEPVIVPVLPAWSAMVAGSPVAASSIIARTPTSIVIGYAAAVDTATAIVVPSNDQSALSHTAQRVPAGTYPLS